MAGSADERSLGLMQESDIRVLRQRYLDGELSLEAFESEVAAVLRGGSRKYAERWEVHVYDAPRGSQLHVHLS